MNALTSSLRPATGAALEERLQELYRRREAVVHLIHSLEQYERTQPAWGPWPWVGPASSHVDGMELKLP